MAQQPAAVGALPPPADSSLLPSQLGPSPRVVKFGLRLGLNYANTNFNQGVPRPVVPVETTWQPGFAAGFLVQLSLNKHLAVQQEYLFSQLSGEIASGGPHYTFRYLSLPLLLKYQVVPRLTLVAGPQFDLLIQAQQSQNGQTTDITHETEERGLGATAGLEVQLWRHLSLGARYLQGLNHMGIGQRPAAQELKLQAVQLAAEFRL
ncbi:porin family protein [Hymenobacter ginkgonis]|uniref:porin family protein n=1 Tax=Hymenobacter ginkgonis TaxID=2682976 RepID=UPI0018DCE580|nr:porin family protein [Hymenobacter ginkgonis]